MQLVYTIRSYWLPSHTSVKNRAGFHKELRFVNEAEVFTGHHEEKEVVTCGIS